MEIDEIGRRKYSPEILSKVCTCTTGWAWKMHPAGPSFAFIHDKCGKPSRYSTVEECEECEQFFFYPLQGQRVACWSCYPD